MRRLLPLAAAVAIACASLSCASMGLTPAPVSMPAARAGLAPELRFFYDALADDGDWVLIEPWGWVYRPHVNFVAWRPYRNGFWAPSDVYGWTWMSTESFGWATYHYGQWLYDRFEGWVWIPGLDWGPAWVTWEQNDSYVGWAPLTPPGTGMDAVPGGAYLYVPTAQLAATDLAERVHPSADVHDHLGNIEAVVHMAQHGGVAFNLGPRFEDVERAAGQPLPRVTLEERAPVLALPPGRPKSGPPARSAAADSASAVRRAGAEEARAARAVAEAKARPPETMHVVRARPAAPDTSR
jgi:hypothetical protein